MHCLFSNHSPRLESCRESPNIGSVSMMDVLLNPTNNVDQYSSNSNLRWVNVIKGEMLPTLAENIGKFRRSLTPENKFFFVFKSRKGSLPVQDRLF